MKLIFLFSVVFALVIFSADGLPCTADAPCVRFCCENCTDFDIADINGAEKLSVNVKALKGQPCESMYALEPFMSSDDEWEILEVSIQQMCTKQKNSQAILQLERRHFDFWNNSQQRPVLSSERQRIDGEMVGADLLQRI